MTPIPQADFATGTTHTTRTVKPKAQSNPLEIPIHLLPSDPLLRSAKIRDINTAVRALQRQWTKSWAHERGNLLRSIGVVDNDEIKHLANQKRVPYKVIVIKVLREKLPSFKPAESNPSGEDSQDQL